MKAIRIENPEKVFKPVVLQLTLTTEDEVRSLITARNRLGAPDLGTAWSGEIREQWVGILNVLGEQLEDDDANWVKN